jgi:hypothetical protein
MGRGKGKLAVPDHTHDFEHKHTRRNGRRLAFLLALGGGVLVAMRRKKNHDDLDEGVWHEAPTS